MTNITNMEIVNAPATVSSRLDRVGMVASCACAVHCALMPVVFGVLPLIGLGVLADERAEWLLVGVAIVIGAASLLPSYFRHHGRATPLLVFAAGLTLVSVGKTLSEEDAMLETLFVVPGALAVALAHFVNRRFCRACCRTG
jgi:hypothetical protein